eukprot:TRINITY_DN2178_c0_g1_i1.p2 TRINITY_DN2178_c0_g1~~TRINITY_DN2178_c0_g1_i1.p2  ORF type:complete len:217 (-),score=16.86 TRINITY_DN2178_c0_g1_i1:431-1081(-)
MVFFFSPRTGGEHQCIIYMGKDKYENEDLIKYGLPHDVWFHVDNLSSAHVYLRLSEGMSIEDIADETLEDCVQLVKANSIQGCKMNNIDVVYTPWSNLRKTQAMDVGQVSFFDTKAVKKVRVDKKNNDIINRLNKTKNEQFPDLQTQRIEYDRQISKQKKGELIKQQQAAKQMKEERKRQEELKSYKHIMTDDQMTSSMQIKDKYKDFEELEDDFM